MWRKVAKVKQRSHDDLYSSLDSKEGENDLYKLRDRDGKDMQQAKVIKDRDGNLLTVANGNCDGKMEKEFVNEEHEREQRVEEVTVLEQDVAKISKAEKKRELKRMKSGKAVGPDYIPVEV